MSDMVTDANAARPVSAGGTGATSPAEARANLGIASAVGLAPELSAASALDTIVTQQWNYVASANVTTVGGPTGAGNGMVFTCPASSTRYQAFYPLTAATPPYRRSYASGAWGSWRADITSTSGVNGYAERFRSGLQICHINRLVLTSGGANSSRCFGTWTLPASFVDKLYSVSVTFRADGADDPSTGYADDSTPTTTMIGATSVSKSTTAAGISAFRQAGQSDFQSGDLLYVDLTATGRWF
jgi:hypothetical protein